MDGQLRGPEVLEVGHHLDVCASCAAEAAELRRVGESLRAAAVSVPLPIDALSGLADGVVSRVRAEEQQSWFARCSHALDDAHWFLVVGGSIAAAIVSVILVCGLIEHTVPEERQDSLAAAMEAPFGETVAVDGMPGIAFKSRTDLVWTVLKMTANDRAARAAGDHGAESAQELTPARRKDLRTVLGELSRLYPDLSLKNITSFE
jgi:hypothetical protein